MSEPACVILCTCPDQTTGGSLAHALVEERLAACVNLAPGVRSVYRWQDAVETAEEILLIIKTTPAAYPALERRLVELHPYEVPEIVCLDVSAGLPAYIEWIGSCLTD